MGVIRDRFIKCILFMKELGVGTRGSGIPQEEVRSTITDLGVAVIIPENARPY